MFLFPARFIFSAASRFYFPCCSLTGEKRPLPWAENDFVEHGPWLSNRVIT